jgi:hypothetical protein
MKPICDFCGKPAEYDSKTDIGPWAYVCIECFRTRCSDSYRQQLKSKNKEKVTGWYSSLHMFD